MQPFELDEFYGRDAGYTQRMYSMSYALFGDWHAQVVQANRGRRGLESVFLLQLVGALQNDSLCVGGQVLRIVIYPGRVQLHIRPIQTRWATQVDSNYQRHIIQAVFKIDAARGKRFQAITGEFGPTRQREQARTNASTCRIRAG